MRPITWILAGLLAVLAIVLLAAGITVHNQPLTIQDATTGDYISIINSTIAKQNTRLHTEEDRLVDVQYINDTIAVVRFDTAEGPRASFLFEYYNNTLYLTNYSTTGFTATDLNDPSIATFIGNAAAQSN